MKYLFLLVCFVATSCRSYHTRDSITYMYAIVLDVTEKNWIDGLTDVGPSEKTGTMQMTIKIVRDSMYGEEPWVLLVAGKDALLVRGRIISIGDTITFGVKTRDLKIDRSILMTDLIDIAIVSHR